MIRQHQFAKVELVSIARPEDSEAEHERMTACAEEVLKRLGSRLSGDAAVDRRHGVRGAEDLRPRSLAAGAERLSRDFELLELRPVPGDADEGARIARPGGKGTRPVHTLNGSGLAVGRTLIAVLENFQRDDGTVAIPEALQPYMGWAEGRSRRAERWLTGASSSANAAS